MVSIDIMNTQINIRLPSKLLASARSYAEEHGFGTVQEFMKETIREKLFDEPEISKEELETDPEVIISGIDELKYMEDHLLKPGELPG